MRMTQQILVMIQYLPHCLDRNSRKRTRKRTAKFRCLWNRTLTGSDGEVTIEDGETPLGLNENMEENTGKNLWWLSVIPVIAAGVAGKAGYDKKYKKGIFAGKQKKEDRNNTGK